MLSKRIIPCLDVKNGAVVKGINFRQHREVGGILDLARYYTDEGADELVFYDITASAEGRRVTTDWISKLAKVLDIPFCVAGGIRSVDDAAEVLRAGADKISVNSPAIKDPELINRLAKAFGRQCVVVGIDSHWSEEKGYESYCNTGIPELMSKHEKSSFNWLVEVQERGAGEIVLNCMGSDGTKKGFDCKQLSKARSLCQVPLIASGGAGCAEDFYEVFTKTKVDGALAASIFHNKSLRIGALKEFLSIRKLPIRKESKWEAKQLQKFKC